MNTDPENNGTKQSAKSGLAVARQAKLAKQMRENLAKRKQQSRARNTKPRKFKKQTD